MLQLSDSIYLGLATMPITVDDTLSTSSTNPVQNKVITQAVNANTDAITVINAELGTNPPWTPSSQWIDIRSGALPNSIYFLVGHSADYTTYPDFNLTAVLSDTTHSYDVFIDGFKQATVASGTETALNWQTLALSTGYDVTYPATLRTHIIRITPANSADTITKVRTTLAKNGGVMWAHFNIDNAIDILGLFNDGDNSDSSKKTPILEAVTSKGGKLKVSGNLKGSFHFCSALVETPVFVSTAADGITAYRAFRQCGALKKLAFEDFSFSNANSLCYQCTSLQEVETKNTVIPITSYTFATCRALKKLPDVSFTDVILQGITQTSNLGPTFIDLSQNDSQESCGIAGTNDYRMPGLKGLIVSSSAPFGTSGTVISVAYTGMDRQALINLFNSLPTITGSPVCNVTGATGANDLTAADLAIATVKNWTITR